jgi:predicted PurR-regulated permease PerM
MPAADERRRKDAMVQRYVPPKQGIASQLFDVAFLLALVFGALFLPIWLKIAVPSRVEKLPDGVSYQTATDGTKTWSGLSWEKLGQNPTMQAQWEKLGYTMETAADIITMPFDYDIDAVGVAVTAVVVIGYFLFMLFMSEKEYKQVIAEKFD